MADKYYVCDIIGDGLTDETPYRAAIAGDSMPWVTHTVAALPTNSGLSTSTWIFTRSPEDINNAQIRKLPVLPPQAAQQAKDALDTILNSMGITPDINKSEYAAALAMIERDYG